MDSLTTEHPILPTPTYFENSPTKPEIGQVLMLIEKTNSDEGHRPH